MFNLDKEQNNIDYKLTEEILIIDIWLSAKKNNSYMDCKLFFAISDLEVKTTVL